MRRKVFLAIIIFLFILLAFALYFYFQRRESDELVLFGNVDVRQVDISFRVAGKVACLAYEEGDCVAEGSLMATLEKSPYTSQISQAQGNLDAIVSSLANAEILLKRREDLIDITGVSQEDLDNARSQVNTLRANKLAAESALAVAKDNLLYTEAYAPDHGIVLTRIREPGSVVKESDPVYTLSLTDPVWIRAFVDEPNLGLVDYGMEAEIFTDTSGGKRYTGKIGFISPVAEFTPKSVETKELRTDLVYRLRIYADNPDAGLKQGMPVTVKLKLPPKNERPKK